MFAQSGAEYFNPDDAARQILQANPNCTQEQANSFAWHEGVRLLERAVRERADFAFETTLGGRTMTGLLKDASATGVAVLVWYVGLEGVGLHLARVAARVRKGGHDIPRERIIQRYDSSRANLIRLLPTLTELRLHDNSVEADPNAGIPPTPLLILHLADAKVRTLCEPSTVPTWSKPIVAAALKIDAGYPTRARRQNS